MPQADSSHILILRREVHQSGQESVASGVGKVNNQKTSTVIGREEDSVRG